MTNQLFEAALGIKAPWYVQGVDFDTAKRQLTIAVDFVAGSRFAYPGVAGEHPVHDTQIKRLRHLNFFQHECYLEVRVPRVKLPNGAVRLVEAYRGDLLIGLLPIAVSAGYGRLPLSCATNWMHRHCFFGAPVLRRGHEAEAWGEFLAQLDGAPWAPHFLYLTGLDAAGANAAALEATCTAQGRARREIHRYDRALLRSDLDADAYWETHVRAKKRKEIRRLQKRLAELGAITERRLTDRMELSTWCSDFLALDRSG